MGTKAEIVSDAANILIKAIKGNYGMGHNDTQMEALGRLSQVFLEATQRASATQIDNTPNQHATRVEEAAPTPRVAKPMIHTKEQTTPNGAPHVIPQDESYDKTANESCQTPRKYLT